MCLCLFVVGTATPQNCWWLTPTVWYTTSRRRTCTPSPWQTWIRTTLAIILHLTRHLTLATKRCWVRWRTSIMAYPSPSLSAWGRSCIQSWRPTEKKKAKGISKRMTSRMLHSSYREVLFGETSSTARRQRITPKNQRVYTARLEKTGLSRYDNKRYVLDDKVYTLAYRPHRIVKWSCAHAAPPGTLHFPHFPSPTLPP